VNKNQSSLHKMQNWCPLEKRLDSMPQANPLSRCQVSMNSWLRITCHSQLLQNKTNILWYNLPCLHL